MIITSLLDTDLYKFTMMQVVLHHFPGAQVEYRFKCRNEGVDLVPLIDEIQQEIEGLCSLRFSEQELNYLRQFRFIKSDFVDFLGLFQMNRKYISITPSTQGNGEIDIVIKGPWLHTILFEIPVLAIVNELYFRRLAPKPDYEEGRRRLDQKIATIVDDPEMSGIRIADYGTRRRFSRHWHEEVLQACQARLGDVFTGTSNVLLAMKYGLKPLGTMAHEYLQACQALGPRLRDSQIFGFETWAREYRGDLGIALSDVYGMDAFLRDFDMYFCKLFDGARHDSGDPFDWGERLIAHYEANRVDPTTKTMVFSDSLTFDLMKSLYYEEHGGTARSAESLGVPEHQVIKTIVLENEHKKGLIVLMHGDRHISTRNLARTLGMKHIEPADPKQANKWTGYLVGGTSPFGTRTSLPVYAEHTIRALDVIYINGGKRGFLVAVSPARALEALNAQDVSVATDG